MRSYSTTYQDETYKVEFARAGGNTMVKVFKLQKRLVEDNTDQVDRMEAVIDICELLVKSAHVDDEVIDTGDMPIHVLEEVIQQHPSFRSGS